MWRFQENTSGMWDGWNDEGIRTFTGNRFKSLTREILQNSLDARLDKSKPVRVEFEYFSITEDGIPGIEDLRSRLAYCKETAGSEGRDQVAEMDEAIKSLSTSEIHVLAIRDFNTEGMAGPCKPGQPFFRYLKAKGESGGDQTRGGSHGIGKAAPLACTKSRTLFVSTCWEEQGVKKHLIQGRTRLRSVEQGRITLSGTGFWGTEDFQPVEAVEQPEFGWLSREAVGTSIFTIGFTKQRTWWQQILGYSAADFFAAIFRGDLEIFVKEGAKEQLLNKSNLAEMFGNPAVKLAMNIAEKDGENALNDAHFFYRCLSQEGNVVERHSEISPVPGYTKINILKEEGAPRRVMLLRRGMVITTEVPGLKRFSPRYSDFACLVEINNQDGNDLIRSMEPPAHDSLSPQNMPDSMRDKGTTLLNRLATEVKKRLEAELVAELKDEGAVDFLKEFLADDTGESGDVDPMMEIDPNGEFQVNPTPIKLVHPPRSSNVEEEVDGEDSSDGDGEGGGATNEENDDTGGNGGSGTGTGQGGSGGEKKPKKQPGIALGHQRAIPNKTGARLIFKAIVSDPVCLEVVEVGADRFETIRVTSSSKGEVRDGRIELTPSDFSDGRCELEVQFGRDLSGGLRMGLTKLVSEES